MDTDIPESVVVGSAGVLPAQTLVCARLLDACNYQLIYHQASRAEPLLSNSVILKLE